MIFIPTVNTGSLIDILAIDNGEHNHIKKKMFNQSILVNSIFIT